MPLDALVSLVITFNEGIILERLSGIETGQAELLQWIDDWLERSEATMTTIDAPAAAREQTRARYPDQEGYVERDGVRVFYEVYGSGEPTVLLLPTWSIIHSRHWKAQIPYLARHARVVTFDGRGNGRSDRPDHGRRPTPSASSPPTRSPSWTRPAPSAPSWWACRPASCGARCSPPSTRSAWRRRCSSRPRRRSPSTLARSTTPFDEPLESYEGWEQVQPPLLARALPRLPRVLLRPGVHRAALDQADRGLRGLGTGDRRARRWR